MRLIDADLYCATICKCNRRACDRAKCPIHNAPTAYDIDKVVEELGDRVNEANNNCLCEMHENGHTLDFENENGRIKGLKEAIEIVKQGGVADDVCEWKSASDGEFIQNPHTKRLYSNEPSMQNVYCNTCGKKIKVVN